MMHFFVILKDEQQPIMRLSVGQNLQKDLTQLFSDQQSILFPRDRETSRFHPGFHPDDDQLSYIDNYELPQNISTSITNPTSVDIFKFGSGEIPHIKGIAASNPSDGALLFQAFDKRRILSNKSVSLILSGHMFRRLEEPGLTLDSKIVLMLLNKKLYFESFFEAARVLDLSAYYREATDEDMDAFCSLESLAVTSPEYLRANADSWIRRRVAAVMESGVLERETPRKIQKEAKSFEINFNILRQNGREKLVLSDDKKEIKIMLKFLLEDFSYGILSGKKYVSSSKKPLG